MHAGPGEVFFPLPIFIPQLVESAGTGQGNFSPIIMPLVFEFECGWGLWLLPGSSVLAKPTCAHDQMVGDHMG